MDQNEKPQPKRATAEQLKLIKDFVEKNPIMMAGKVICNNKEKKDNLWKEVTKLANDLAGPKKTSQEWKRSLVDVRCKTKKKARDAQFEQFQTVMLPIEELSDPEPTVIVKWEQEVNEEPTMREREERLSDHSSSPITSELDETTIRKNRMYKMVEERLVEMHAHERRMEQMAYQQALLDAKHKEKMRNLEIESIMLKIEKQKKEL